MLFPKIREKNTVHVGCFAFPVAMGLLRKDVGFEVGEEKNIAARRRKTRKSGLCRRRVLPGPAGWTAQRGLHPHCAQRCVRGDGMYSGAWVSLTTALALVKLFLWTLHCCHTNAYGWLS